MGPRPPPEVTGTHVGPVSMDACPSTTRAYPGHSSHCLKAGHKRQGGRSCTACARHREQCGAHRLPGIRAQRYGYRAVPSIAGNPTG